MPKLQNPAHVRGLGGFQGFGYRGFLQVWQLCAAVFQPAQELRGAVGVAQVGDLLGFLVQLRTVLGTTPKRAAGQLTVGGNPAAVHPHVVPPLPPDEIRHLERLQQVVNVSFSLNVADIVLSENLPLGGVVTWQVTDAATVGLGWLAGAAEVTDQGLALPHLGFVVGQLEGFACVFQAGGQAAVHGVNHAVFPLLQPIFTLLLG